MNKIRVEFINCYIKRVNRLVQTTDRDFVLNMNPRLSLKLSLRDLSFFFFFFFHLFTFIFYMNK